MMALLLHELEKVILDAKEANSHPEGAKGEGSRGIYCHVRVKEGANHSRKFINNLQMMTMLLHELEKVVLDTEEADSQPEGARGRRVEGSTTMLR